MGRTSPQGPASESSHDAPISSARRGDRRPRRARGPGTRHQRGCADRIRTECPASRGAPAQQVLRCSDTWSGRLPCCAELPGHRERTGCASGRGPGGGAHGLRPRRSAGCVQVAGVRGNGPDGGCRRRPRQPEGGGRPRGVPREVRSPTVHHSQRVLPQGRRVRYPAAALGRHRLGAGDLIGPGHGFCGVPGVQHPVGGGERPRHHQRRHR